MANNIYTKKVIEHFKHPRNYGKMKKPHGTGKAGNVICGDVLWLYIKVSKNRTKKETIEGIKFETLGCPAAIATSSIITELAKGKTLKQAIKINRDEIVKSLGGLPPPKVHCSILAVDALSEAIYDYLLKKKKPIPQELTKKHKRIEKEKKIIEEKYKEWR